MGEWRYLKCMSLKTLSIIELVVHATCIALCGIASGFSARSIYVTEVLYNDFLDFTPLVLALSSVTILLLSSSLIFTIFQRQPFLSKICVELVWSGLLWSIWMGTAGYVTWANTCPWAITKDGMACQVHPALTLVSFLVGILLFWHWITLLVVGHKLNEGGQRTWNMSLKELALRVPLAGSRDIQIEPDHEEPKFEYEQPGVNMFPLPPPPAYVSYSVSVSPVPRPPPGVSMGEFTPSFYSLQHSPGGVSYSTTVDGYSRWQDSQQRLPEGYEIPTSPSHSHGQESPDPESHSSTPGDTLVNHSKPVTTTGIDSAHSNADTTTSVYEDGSRTRLSEPALPS